jgi:hypothetical protein
MKTPGRATPPLDALQSLLSTARDVVDDLLRDPLLHRLIGAFYALPETHREPILRVLERDATWLRIVDEAAGATGITVRPNPHASLYLHVLDEVGPSARDVDVIRFGIERFVALFPLFFQEGVHEQWMRSAKELVAAADPEVRALGRRLAHEVLALIDEVEPKQSASGE